MIIKALSYHRNGVSGAGYFSARLTWRGGDGRKYTGTAIVFDRAEHVAVFSDDGVHFRCEDFERELRALIASPGGDTMAFPYTAA